jgi:DNA-binding FrmR family transcriptional regulator
MNKKKWQFEKSTLIDRLSRVEGQVKALKKILDEAHEPSTVLQQLKAASSAIDQVSRVLIIEYMKSEFKDSAALTRIEKYSELVKKYGI